MRVLERARAMMPALSGWSPSQRETTIDVELREAPTSLHQPTAPERCLKVTHDTLAGQIPSRADFTASDCANMAGDQPFRYEPNAGAVRTLRDLHAGEILAAAPLSMLAAIRPGQALYVASHVGPVIVERRVEAVQAAAAGHGLFVRSTDGAIFPAPAPDQPR